MRWLPLICAPFIAAFVTPNDPLFPGTTTTGQWNLRMMGVDKVWKHTRGAGVKIAVIDTGIPMTGEQPSHEDAPVNYRSDIDHDYVNDDGQPSESFVNGIQNLGIIAAATNNATGHAGIAPDAEVVLFQALQSGTGTTVNMTDAINDAVVYGADVIFLGFSSPEPMTTYAAALTAAVNSNAIVVNATGTTAGNVNYPAQSTGVVGVGILTSAKARFSSSGYDASNDYVDLMAPGAGIPILSHLSSTGYTTSIGSGAGAAAHVAGAAALVWSHCRGKRAVTKAEVLAALTNNTERIGSDTGYTRTNGHGLVRVDLALEAFPECFVTVQPVAATVVQGRSVVIPANADGGEGDVLSFAPVTQPAQGVASVAAGGISYFAPANASGAVTFTYRGSDSAGHNSSAASVTVDILPNTVPMLATPTSSAAAALVTLTSGFTDGDPGEAHTATVSWTQGGVAEAAVINGSDITAVHTYAAPGTYEATVCVRDIAEAQSCVTHLIVVPSFSVDLRVSATTKPAQSEVRAATEFVFHVENAGPHDAPGVTFVVTQEGALAALKDTSSSACAQSDDGAITCTYGALAVGADIDVSLILEPIEEGRLELTATASCAAADPNPGDNSASTTTTIEGGDLDISGAPMIARGCACGSTEDGGSALLALLVLSFCMGLPRHAKARRVTRRDLLPHPRRSAHAFTRHSDAVRLPAHRLLPTGL